MAATVGTLYEVLKNAPSNLILSVEMAGELVKNVAVKEVRLSQVTIFSEGKDHVKINKCILVLESK